MFNMLDFASYLPLLGKLTSGLGESSRSSEGLRIGTKSRRSRRKKEKVVLVKKPIYACDQLNADFNQVSTKQRKTGCARRKLKKLKIGRRLSKKDEPGETTENSLDVNNVNNLSKEVIVAIEDFKVKRDQFVRSLDGLQKKLLSFRIPDLFKPHQAINEESTEQPSSKSKLEMTGKQGKKKTKKSKGKEVRSVSQHFFLADMTESERSKTTSSSSLSSSSSESCDQDAGDSSELELSNRKVKKYLENDVIPSVQAQNKKTNRSEQPVKSFKKRKANSKKVDVYWSRLRKRLGDMNVNRAPAKEEDSRQRRMKSESFSDMKGSGADRNSVASPRTQAAVQTEFKRLKKASEDKLQDKFERAVSHRDNNSFN